MLEAFKAVNNRVKRMTSSTEDGSRLMSHALTGDPPTVRINTGETVSDQDEQKGFALLFMGAMQGIRNPKAHEGFEGLDHDRTLDYLSFASLLMRRLDDAAGLAAT